MIGIVDYGLGNLEAFNNIYRRLGIPARRVSLPDELAEVERLILPGVGAFDWAISRLAASGMTAALNSRVLQDRIPVLGVCVGMQIMADSSEEGTMPGLGWISGRVRRFNEEFFNVPTHLPHMGWNDVDLVGAPSLFSDIAEPKFYFLHSYFFQPTDNRHTVARTHYGEHFASAIRRDNIWATQFHPEKSHGWGIKLLKNFAEA
jgi:glutamine amidotransferase